MNVRQTMFAKNQAARRMSSTKGLGNLANGLGNNPKTPGGLHIGDLLAKPEKLIEEEKKYDNEDYTMFFKQAALKNKVVNMFQNAYKNSRKHMPQPESAVPSNEEEKASSAPPSSMPPAIGESTFK
jgi:hypothetical protein